MDLKAKVLQGADAIDARDRFDSDARKSHMNASEAMSCIRKQWYAKNDAEMDGPEDWGFARRGSHAEKYVVECLRMANVPLLFAGDEQTKIADDDLQIACTPDGLFMNEDGESWTAIEIKSIDPRTNVSNLPRENHVTQVQIAAAMFEKHADEFPELQGLPVTGCALLYIDASNFNTLHMFHVRKSARILDKLAGRASRLLKATSAARLPREGKEQGGRECATMCQFTRVCGVDKAATSTGQGRAGAADAAVQVRSYVSAKADEAAAKADKDKAAEQLKALMSKDGVSRLEVEGHTVSLSVRAGSVSYAKVVKEHCPDVDLEPYRGNPSEVLTVK